MINKRGGQHKSTISDIQANNKSLSDASHTNSQNTKMRLKFQTLHCIKHSFLCKEMLRRIYHYWITGAVSQTARPRLSATGLL